ncbi:MAG: hypothetical protein WBW35_06595, partial [Xanthobacteraceae bacterium]
CRRVGRAGEGGRSQKRSDCGSKTDRYTHGSFWLPGFDAQCSLLWLTATALPATARTWAGSNK